MNCSQLLTLMRDHACFTYMHVFLYGIDILLEIFLFWHVNTLFGILNILGILEDLKAVCHRMHSNILDFLVLILGQQVLKRLNSLNIPQRNLKHL